MHYCRLKFVVAEGLLQVSKEGIATEWESCKTVVKERSAENGDRV